MLRAVAELSPLLERHARFSESALSPEACQRWSNHAEGFLCIRLIRPRTSGGTTSSVGSDTALTSSSADTACTHSSTGIFFGSPAFDQLLLRGAGQAARKLAPDSTQQSPGCLSGIVTCRWKVVMAKWPCHPTQTHKVRHPRSSRKLWDRFRGMRDHKGSGLVSGALL